MIRFKSGELPRVIGRAMGLLGGEMIDNLLLRVFWLNQKRQDSLPLTLRDFHSLPKISQTLLLAHARLTKELISTQLMTLAQDITGVIPGFGKSVLVAPRVSRNNFQQALETVEFPAESATTGETRSASLRGHILALLEELFENSIDTDREKGRGVQITRSAISSLIFAGGSSQLPGVKEWVFDFLTSDQGKGRANDVLTKNVSSIHKDHPDICVAGGAAIHQLYKHHAKRELRKVITPTLSSPFWLIHYRDNNNRQEVKVLGKVGDPLPIDRQSYWKAEVIFPARRWENGEMQFVIGEGEIDGDAVPNWQVYYELPIEFGGVTPLESLLKAILIRYVIDEYGVIQRITWTPGFLPSGWNPKRSIREFNLFANEANLGTELDNLRRDNLRRITSLRKIFIPTSR